MKGNESAAPAPNFVMTGTESEGMSGGGGGGDSGGNRGWLLKGIVILGGAILLKKLTESTSRWDHAHVVADSLVGEKVRFVCVWRRD